MRDVLRRILTLTEADEVEVLRAAAGRTLLAHCGDSVRLRGLVEFSNRCVLDCRYCGIRRGNRAVKRFSLSVDEVVDCARWCADKGYGLLVLQSGERHDAAFVRRVETMIRAIKNSTRSSIQPDGLGITLCVGEQSEDTYARWFEAGAHRYLLRIETSSPILFAALHPPAQRHETRLACLHTLRRLGYQVGTGVMIGLPGQSVEHLIDDLLFFREMDVDMLGMGPYIPHAQAALADDGREQGLTFGANVIMPQVTPPRVRAMYTLYDGKPCLDDTPEQCADCLDRRIASVGRRSLKGAWGDSAHFATRAGRR